MVSVGSAVEPPLVKIDRNINTLRQETSFPKNLEESIADAIELSIDGVRLEIPETVE